MTRSFDYTDLILYRQECCLTKQKNLFITHGKSSVLCVQKEQQEVLLLGAKAKKIFGIVTTVAILGVTIYVIKKYYDSKKQDEKSIDLEEAKRIVDEDDRDYVNAHAYHKTKELGLNDYDMEDVKFGARDLAHYDPNFKRRGGNVRLRTLGDEQMEEIVDDARDQANYNASFTNANVVERERPIAVKPKDVNTGHDLEAEEEEEDLLNGPDPQEVQDSKGYFEEDKEVIDDLRYEPNSMEAREQFINMELANLGRDNDTQDVVAMLYDHPFVPTSDEDQNLKTRLIDHRIKFFGLVSRWTKEVTYGDVVMYYGKAAEFNCDNDVRYWVDYFLTCADLNNITLTSDEIDERINLLNKHNFFNDGLQSHGLFGLTSAQMTEAIIVARKRIDEKVTYDIEFHQFVQGII
jgi:hypothetical protein